MTLTQVVAKLISNSNFTFIPSLSYLLMIYNQQLLTSQTWAQSSEMRPHPQLVICRLSVVVSQGGRRSEVYRLTEPIYEHFPPQYTDRQ